MEQYHAGKEISTAWSSKSSSGNSKYRITWQFPLIHSVRVCVYVTSTRNQKTYEPATSVEDIQTENQRPVIIIFLYNIHVIYFSSLNIYSWSQKHLIPWSSESSSCGIWNRHLSKPVCILLYHPLFEWHIMSHPCTSINLENSNMRNKQTAKVTRVKKVNQHTPLEKQNEDIQYLYNKLKLETVLSFRKVAITFTILLSYSSQKNKLRTLSLSYILFLISFQLQSRISQPK